MGLLAAGGGAERVERRGREVGQLADQLRVVLREVGAARLVGELEEAVAPPSLSAHRGGESAAHRRVVGSLLAERVPRRVRLDLGLREPDDLAHARLGARSTADFSLISRPVNDAKTTNIVAHITSWVPSE